MTLLRRVNRNETYAGETTLEITPCGVCGVLFAAPEPLIKHCRQTGDSFFCPNGHSLVFGNYENARLKRELKEARDHLARQRAARDQTEASLRATKGHVTRLRRRAAAGVCPCCTRTFQDLARHMQSQHPEFAAG